LSGFVSGQPALLAPLSSLHHPLGTDWPGRLVPLHFFALVLRGRMYSATNPACCAPSLRLQITLCESVLPLDGTPTKFAPHPLRVGKRQFSDTAAEKNLFGRRTRRPRERLESRANPRSPCGARVDRTTKRSCKKWVDQYDG
jgi:hypothetical protein